jgi:hypothetical protein
VKQDLITIYGHCNISRVVSCSIGKHFIQQMEAIDEGRYTEGSLVYSSLFGQNLKTDYFNILGMI